MVRELNRHRDSAANCELHRRIRNLMNVTIDDPVLVNQRLQAVINLYRWREAEYHAGFLSDKTPTYPPAAPVLIEAVRGC